jgi:hypothetical protein
VPGVTINLIRACRARGNQPEQQSNQRAVGPGDPRPGTLAELALQDGELVLE